MADAQKNDKLIGRIKTSLGHFSIRGRIALAILLTFVLVLPAVSLSLIYLTNLISSMTVITEQDVRLGRMANDLSFTIPPPLPSPARWFYRSRHPRYPQTYTTG